jgi:hypothetical protein
MSLSMLHAGLANTATLFVAALGIWALLLWWRNQSLEGGWFGAAVLGEILLIVQGVVGGLLFLQGLDVRLVRPGMHILYGVVAVVTLPASYAYFGNLEDQRVKTLAMAFTCFFLWGILLRASTVVYFDPYID